MGLLLADWYRTVWWQHFHCGERVRSIVFIIVKSFIWVWCLVVAMSSIHCSKRVRGVRAMPWVKRLLLMDWYRTRRWRYLYSGEGVRGIVIIIVNVFLWVLCLVVGRSSMLLLYWLGIEEVVKEALVVVLLSLLLLYWLGIDEVVKELLVRVDLVLLVFAGFLLLVLLVLFVRLDRLGQVNDL